jgi:clan AA aspartic protease (TIGR02281 family)
MSFWMLAGGQLGKWALLVLPALSAVNVKPAVKPSVASGAIAVRNAGFVDITPRAVLDSGEINRAPDGLFYINAQVNGTPVRVLVDTGASTIVLTKSDAARAGVLPDNDAFDQSADTAGGATTMARTKLAHFTAAATERRDVDAVIASEGLGVSLLGQSWLSQLESLQIKGDRMVMR